MPWEENLTSQAPHHDSTSYSKFKGHLITTTPKPLRRPYQPLCCVSRLGRVIDFIFLLTRQAIYDVPPRWPLRSNKQPISNMSVSRCRVAKNNNNNKTGKAAFCIMQCSYTLIMHQGITNALLCVNNHKFSLPPVLYKNSVVWVI